MDKTSFLYILFSLGYIINIQAQKLPNVQQGGMRAPTNVKIDGKATEWSNKFQAYNHATSIYYTLCNDDNNLYLVAQANDPDVLTKITNRGVHLVINPLGKKTDKDAISITYPIFEAQYGNKPYIRFSNASGLTHAQHLAIEANPDSMLRVANKKLHDNEKYIRTSGMSDIDTLLSIYNDNGIVAREGFETGMNYTYELAVPLKYLKLSSGNAMKFTYHIVLAGMNIDQDMGMQVTTAANGMPLVTFSKGAITIMNNHLPVVTSTTDFWGEYILAQK